MIFENKGSRKLVVPLFPYTAPPTVAATNPNVQNTKANPAANAIVGRVVSLSSRSPAAVEMYDIVKGNSPHTHGLIEVNNPAPYITTDENTQLMPALPDELWPPAVLSSDEDAHEDAND